MNRIGIALIALLAGCATSPQEVVERGTRFIGDMGKPPLEAARCIGRNAQYTNAYIVTTINEIDADNTELIVRGTFEITTTLSVWRFRKQASGATFEAWVTEGLLGSPTTHIKHIRGTC